MNIHYIKQIRSYLTIESSQQLVHSLIISHLDYANSLLIGLPSKTLQRLQCIQNMAPKLILNYGKFDSATEARYRLHWLPVAFRCQFKAACLVHKALRGKSPTYLQELLVSRDTKI
jgi:hypothetical protein